MNKKQVAAILDEIGTLLLACPYRRAKLLGRRPRVLQGLQRRQEARPRQLPGGDPVAQRLVVGGPRALDRRQRARGRLPALLHRTVSVAGF